MSFPNVIYGSYGDEKVSQSTKIGNLPLGVLMVLPRGEKFRHAKMSATAGVAGNLYQQDSLANVGTAGTAITNSNLAVAASVAVGATTVTITLAGTGAVTKDEFADGVFFVAASSGAGHRYAIKSCNSAAAGSTLTITLWETDPIKVALAAASTKVGLRQNPFDNLTVNTADTVRVGSLAGILPVAASASHYCWVQRGGQAPALNDNTTLIVGLPISASKQLAGAVGVALATTTVAGVDRDMIGYCEVVAAASAGYGLVNLKLE